MCNGTPLNRCIAKPSTFTTSGLQSAKSLRRHHDLDQQVFFPLHVPVQCLTDAGTAHGLGE
jgi:hypothetical protein